MMWPSPGPGHASYGGAGGLLHDGDPVSTWLDSSGNGNAATQIGAQRPVFKANIINGKPVVRYGGSGSQLNIAAITAFPWTWMVVMRQNAGDFNSIVGNGAGGSGVLSPAGMFFRADGYGMVSSTNGRSQGYVAPGYGSVPHIYAAYCDTTASQPPVLYVDGTNVVMTSFGPSAVADFVLLGSGNGDMAEGILYNVAVLATDRANLEKYLGTKYGITVAGGTAVDPSTVAGLVGWWKADSLG